MSVVVKGVLIAALRQLAHEYPYWRDELSESGKIILDHCAIAGACGLIPIPYVSPAVMLGAQVVMYGRLNTVFGVSLSKNTMKVIGRFLLSQMAGMIAAFPILFLGLAAGGLLKMIPGIGSFAGGITDAAINAAITYVLGIVYVMALSKTLGGKQAVTEATLKTAIEAEFQDKDKIKGIYKEGREATRNMDFASRKQEAQAYVDEAEKTKEN